MIEGIGRFPETRFGFCVVVLCHGQDEGRKFFAYVAIEPQNLNHFKERYERGKFSSFSAFGQELLRGWGNSPSAEITEFLLRQYDIELDVSHIFVDRLVALATDFSVSSPLKPAVASTS